MGKKKRLKRYPQKFGKKLASHPYAKALAKLKEAKERALEDGIVTLEEKAEIAEVEKVVELLTPNIEIKEVEKPPAEKPIVKKAAKPRRTRRATTKKRTTKKKVEESS